MNDATSISDRSAPGVVTLMTDWVSVAGSMAMRDWAGLLSSWLMTAGLFVGGVPTAAWLGLFVAAATAGLLLARHDGRPLAGTSARVVLATVLVSMVLGFFLLLSIMAGGFVVFAVMAGSGFDFEAAGAGADTFGPAFDAFMETPGGQISQAVFWLAVAIWAVSLGRALPYAAATADEQRVIVLEAFNRSRGKGLRYLALVLVGLGPAAATGFLSLSFSGSFPAAIAAGASMVLAAIGLAAASAVVNRASTRNTSKF